FICLGINHILAHSEPLQDIFGIPPTEGTVAEGTKENPLRVPGVTVQEFEGFLQWMNHEEWTSPDNLSEEKLIAILKVTKIWMIQDGLKFTLHHLEKKHLSSTHWLQLAQQFSIQSWIQPAVVELLETPILQLEDINIAQIGLHAFTILAKAKESLEHQCRLYAWYP
ncbi:hypothetical protein P691DRAFT_624531, partial [Macrolepiota fuliginosa MF-IS2]